MPQKSPKKLCNGRFLKVYVIAKAGMSRPQEIASYNVYRNPSFPNKAACAASHTPSNACAEIHAAQ